MTNTEFAAKLNSLSSLNLIIVYLSNCVISYNQKCNQLTFHMTLNSKFSLVSQIILFPAQDLTTARTHNRRSAH